MVVVREREVFGLILITASSLLFVLFLSVFLTFPVHNLSWHMPELSGS